MSVSLKWITPNAQQEIIDIARVSTDKPAGTPGAQLLRYLLNHQHWSPFEMANMCVDINTTRDISHQLIRHRSFSFQEFSQRYSVVKSAYVKREVRYQHPTNRQASIELDPSREEDQRMKRDFEDFQDWLWGEAYAYYRETLDLGGAKECARIFLPEGMAPTHVYMNGTIRSWIHFYQARSYEGAQKEIRLIADGVGSLLSDHLPVVWEAMNAREE